MNSRRLRDLAELCGPIVLAIVIEGCLLLRGIEPPPLAGLDGLRQALSFNSLMAKLDRATTADPKSPHGPKNPFLAYLSDSAGFRYEPLLGYSNANDYGQGFNIDYFGFRNSGYPYVGSDDRRIIVMTGNSELRGVHHTQGSIAQHLESALTRMTSERFRVINLAMDGHTLTYEITAFLHLAYQLRPAAVISHSFYLDMHHCYVAPEEYAKLGLCFNAHLAPKWAQLISQGNVRPLAFEYAGARDRGVVYDSLIANLTKYKEIAQASGAVFLVGLQKFEERFSVGSPSEQDVKAYRVLQKRLSGHLKAQSVGGMNFVDFNDPQYAKIEIVDGVHTSAESAKKIAEAYAEVLAPLLKQRQK